MSTQPSQLDNDNAPQNELIYEKTPKKSPPKIITIDDNFSDDSEIQQSPQSSTPSRVDTKIFEHFEECEIDQSQSFPFESHETLFYSSPQQFVRREGK